jgi:putative transport protein
MVLFVGLAFGHFGYHIDQSIADLGLILFMYAVGLQAGPRFFRVIARSGKEISVVTIIPLVLAGLTLFVCSHIFSLSPSLTLGIFAGALTNSAALASGSEALGATLAEASVAYGAIFPFAMVVTIGILQLTPRFLKLHLPDEDARWREEMKQHTPSVECRHFRLTNPNCRGLSLREIGPRLRYPLAVSRVTRHGETIFPSPDFVFEEGDILSVVLQQSDILTVTLLIGDEVTHPLEMDPSVAVFDIEVSESSLTGKTLKALDFTAQYHVHLTRIKRQGLEFVPSSTSTLEIGDTIRAVGRREDAERFASLAGKKEHIINETTMIPFLGGLLIGVLFGKMVFPLPGGISVSFGAAGGAFLTSLLIGHFGKIGTLPLYVPQAAKNFSREFGVILFLAAAGTQAGDGLLDLLKSQGLLVVSIGISVTAISLAATLLLSRYYIKGNIIASLGNACGMMTNSTALSSVQRIAASELAALSYAASFPISLIAKIILSQVLLLCVKTFQ